MSNYTDASLIYYPSGYKASKAYSLKPTDGSGDLTFTRASTATRVNESGLIEEVAANVPRLDNSQGGCSTLLLEPQRTNLVTYSEDFSNAAWGKANAGIGVAPIVTSNQGTSPDGTNNADRIVFNKGNSTSEGDFSLITRGITVPNQNHTVSFYFKSYDGTAQSIRVFNILLSTFVDVDLGSEWVRVELSSLPFVGTNAQVRFGLRGTSVSTSDILVFGASLELGSYATSYIPTTTTAVTRVADSATKSGISSLIGQTEGVLYAEISTNNDTATKTITLSDGTSNNRIQLFYFNGVAIYGSCSSAGANQALIFTNIDVSNNIKVAFKYKVNDFALWVNGVKVAFDTTGAVPTNLNTLIFNNASGLSDFYGNVQNLMIFPSALSDTELATLTTI